MKTVFTCVGYTLVLLGALDLWVFGSMSELKSRYLLLHTSLSVILMVSGIILIWVCKRNNN